MKNNCLISSMKQTEVVSGNYGQMASTIVNSLQGWGLWCMLTNCIKVPSEKKQTNKGSAAYNLIQREYSFAQISCTMDR